MSGRVICGGAPHLDKRGKGMGKAKAQATCPECGFVFTVKRNDRLRVHWKSGPQSEKCPGSDIRIAVYNQEDRSRSGLRR